MQAFKIHLYLIFTLLLSVKYYYGQFTIYNTQNSGLTDNNCWFVNQQPGGDVWVGTQTKGAFKFNGTLWTSYTPTNSGIPSNFITPIIFENTSVWLGSYSGSGGLSMFSNNTWSLYNTFNSGIPGNDIMSITIDNIGNKWIGTRYNGISKFNGAIWTNYNTSNSGLPSNQIYAIESDNLGNIWIGTALNGLVKFDGTNWIHYTNSNSPLLNNSIYCLKFNHFTSKLWIGTYGGINTLDNTNQWVTYNTSTPGFPDNYIRGITHFPNTSLTFIATGYGGIGRFNANNWTTFNTGNSNLPSNKIWSINFNSLGEIWASTWGAGIVKLKNVLTDIPEQDNSIPDASIITYPNPCATTFYVKAINLPVSALTEIRIYGIHGGIVLKQDLSSSLQVNVSDLPCGFYVYTIHSSEHVLKTGKLTVVK